MCPIVREYIEKGGGNFLTTKNCKVDATVTIKAVSLDEETFDKSYVVVNGIYDPSGEECNVRLGVQNLKRIAENLGDDETTWVNKKLECIGTQDYPGLGQKGLLWRGVSQSVLAPKESGLEETITKILNQRQDLSRNDIQTMMTDEIAKATGTLSEEAAAHLVAKSLGVK